MVSQTNSAIGLISGNPALHGARQAACSLALWRVGLLINFFGPKDTGCQRLTWALCQSGRRVTEHFMPRGTVRMLLGVLQTLLLTL
jgi:hypothetical protein